MGLQRLRLCHPRPQYTSSPDSHEAAVVASEVISPSENVTGVLQRDQPSDSAAGKGPEEVGGGRHSEGRGPQDAGYQEARAPVRGLLDLEHGHQVV